jgi:hypothetical protein
MSSAFYGFVFFVVFANFFISFNQTYIILQLRLMTLIANPQGCGNLRQACYAD